MCNWRDNKGYTLIEVLIALAIFAIVGGLATQALIQVTKHQKIIIAKQRNLKKIARTINILESDINFSIARTVRDNQTIYPAFIGKTDVIELTKNNFPNPQNKAKRSNMQRVSWFCKNNKLTRRTWYLLDMPSHLASSAYQDQVILKPVKTCEFVFLDDNLAVQNNWPNMNINPQLNIDPKTSLPRAVRFSIDLPVLGQGDFLFLINN